MFPDLATLLPLVALLFVVGAFAGIIAGLLGVGGGIVLVPAFFYVFTALGYGGPQVMQVCLATSLATIIFTSIRSVMAHNRKGAVDWEVLKTWAPGIVIGAIIGTLVASQLRSVALQAIFGGLGMVVGLYMAFGRQSWRIAGTMPTGPVRAAQSSVLGFLSVLMGIGGGSFGVPLMTLYGVPIHRAVATASGFGVTIAVPSVIGFLFMPLDPATRPPLTLGAVNLPAFAVVIGITMVTTSYGVKLAHAMDPKPLKRIFAVFLILVAANMLRKALGW
ncbi:sulfite exporter TauE/SafE family protein [Pseudogemmobacter bohemicus]|uniref:sulfite exporter TauE/SafE family protein n=1 Tax=Pseudogemmobacter bohemicus TaxID=2250708 RepID=UPI000DD4951B|nr:sulfite exporter TauE/SafE family protein [Pseudogemmobacter bohemicus]